MRGVSRFCLLVLLLGVLLQGAVEAIDRPRINPFPDVAVGETITLRPMSDGVFVESSPGVKPGSLVACMRIRIHGIPRLRNIEKFAVVTRVKVEAAAQSVYRPALPKVEVCMHRNGSMEVAQCSKESWRALEKSVWSGVASPFETKYVDLRVTEALTDVPLNISAVEEGQGFRIAFLVVGMVLLLIAPIVSDWVPFYYSSAMTLGIFLVIIVLLYQGMKLLPTGRKSSLWLLLYGSLLGMGTVVMHYFSGLVTTLLNELGLGDDLFNPVAVFLGLGVVLVGAWLGFWGVRKMVLAEDGNIDSGVAKFVKWAIRVIGGAMLLQSSYDIVFAVLALALGLASTWILGKIFNALEKLSIPEALQRQWSEYWESEGVIAWAGEKLQELWSKRPRMQRQDAFRPSFRRGVIKKPITKTQANSLQNLPGKEALTRWEQVSALSRRHLTAPRADLATPSPTRVKEFYSTYHKTPDRQPLSSSDYKATDMTGEAVGDLVRSRDFQEWWANNVVTNNRVSIAPNEHREERPEEEVEATASLPEDDFLLSKNSNHSRRYPGLT
ncbi:hypothetical protein KC19_4G217300 [Ceratodon purpureus]|uniref:Uncharacterized protein n=1 Tax=Ceratodon purpureus TaxID=3225 RepID=A0A8T0IDN5_CERPU|nr:hypothetical protein KC19_4G217300 [Ceratodon purpureus]